MNPNDVESAKVDYNNKGASRYARRRITSPSSAAQSKIKN